MTIIKKYGPYIAAAIIILFLGVRVLNVTDSYSKAKGEYVAHVKTAEETASRLRDMVTAQSIEIVKRDADIGKANERIAVLSASASVAAGNLASLEAEYRAILASGGDKDSIITNQAKQIDAWKARFTLSESTIVEKDKIIFGLQEKFALQTSISLAWKSQFENEQSIRFDAEKMIKSLEWKVRITRAKSTIVTLAAIAVGSYFLYDKFFGK